MAGGTGAFQAGTLLPGFLFDILANQNSKQGTSLTGFAVASTATVRSQSFILRRGVTYNWEFRVTSSGTVALTIELEESNQPPNTELSQDDSFVIPIGKGTTNGLVPTGNITAAGTYRVLYTPAGSAVGRLKITGTGSNDASTVVTVAKIHEVRIQ